MSNHYRFTNTMTFLIDTIKKTIIIIGSYKYEDLREADKTVLSQYQGYTVINAQPTYIIK